MDFSTKSKDELVRELKEAKEKLRLYENNSVNGIEKTKTSPGIYWNSIFYGCAYQILIINKEGIILNVNHFPDGSNANVILGKCAYDFILPKSKERYISTIHKIYETGKTDTIELEGVGPGGSARTYFSLLFPVIEEHKVSSVIVIIQDITENKFAEKRLVDNEARLKILLEQTPAMLWSVDRNLILTSSVGLGLKTLGFKQNQLVGKPLSSIIVNGNKIEGLQAHSDAIHLGKPKTYSYSTGNNYFDVFIEPLYDTEKNIIGAIGLATDVSVNRRNERQILDLQERYKKLAELTTEGIIIHDGNFILEVNKAACKMTGYEESELLGFTLNEVGIIVESASMERLKKNVIEKNNVYHQEMVVRKKNGEHIFCEAEAKTTAYKNGEARVVTFRDITARKVAERVARETEEKYKKFSEATSEGVVIHENGIIIEANSAFYKIWGYKESEIIGSNISKLLDKETAAFVLSNIKEKKEGRFEIYIKCKNGEKKLCEYEGKEIKNENVITRVVTFRDISRRREAEEFAKESEDRFKRLSEASFESILIHEKGKIFDFNETCCTMFGYSAEELRSMTAFELAIEEERPFLIQQVRKGYQKPYETIGLRKDGTTFAGEVNGKEFSYKGKKARVVAIRDISDRKRYEMKLRQVNKDYENLVRQSPDGIFILDKKGKILFANPSAHNIVGVKSLEEIMGQSIYDFIIPNYHKEIKQREQLLNEGYDLPFMKMEAIRMDGSVVEVEYKPVIIDYQGKKATLIVYHDIDFQEQLAREKTRYKISEETNKALKKEIIERKNIEEKLNNSKEQYKAQSAKLNSIIESSSHIVWTIDRNIALTSFNENFAQQMHDSYGVRPALKSLINKGKFISSKEYNEFWNKKFKATLLGHPQHFETRFENKKGYVVWREIYLNPIFDENGKVKEVSGIGHDITEKKLAEEKIKQSLKEKEVLLKEVHHRVKNNLQVISSILNLQSSYVTDKKTVDLLKESQNRIKSMSFIHESLYQTKDFTSVNFAEYVQNISNNLVLSYNPKGKKVALKQKIDNVFLNLDLAIPCGLIINELISNALKYAFLKKNKGELTISIAVDKKENVKMIIADNGEGLPKGLDYRNTQSLGLQLVMVLVSQLRGTIKLDNKGGAKYSIIFNKQNVN